MDLPLKRLVMDLNVYLVCFCSFRLIRNSVRGETELVENRVVVKRRRFVYELMQSRNRPNPHQNKNFVTYNLFCAVVMEKEYYRQTNLSFSLSFLFSSLLFEPHFNKCSSDEKIV
jgi:hypothetical protein